MEDSRFSQSLKDLEKRIERLENILKLAILESDKFYIQRNGLEAYNQKLRADSSNISLLGEGEVGTKQKPF